MTQANKDHKLTGDGSVAELSFDDIKNALDRMNPLSKFLTWTDQLMPIKQSAPVMLTLFGGMGYTILLFAGFLLLPGWRLGFAGYAACFAAANLLLCAVLHRWLRKKGAALFAAL